MASIYQNAYLVISASKSPGSQDSLFGGLDERSSPSTITIPSLGQGTALCFRKSVTHLPGYMDQKLIKPSPLPTFNRGWIFQERLLSSRVLHFGPQELSWECLEESACQCTGTYSSSTTPDLNDGAATTSYTMSALRILKPKAIFNQSYWQRLNQLDLAKVWHMLVEDYTKLNLTFESDIFPAMSGIAKSFQRHTQSEYVAGMWTKSLLSDLAWHKETPSSGSTKQIEWHRRPQEWRAPTWSWASSLGPVQFLDIGDGSSAFCDIKEAKCFAYQADLTGELKSGHLFVHGNLIPTTIQYKSHVKQDTRKPYELFDLSIMQGQVGNVWADYDSSLPGPNYIPPDTTTSCLMLKTRIDSGSLELLLLREVGFDEEICCTTWERLGLIQLSCPSNVVSVAKDYWLERFTPQLKGMTLIKIV